MRRRSFIGVLVTLLLSVALAGSAFAQGGGRGGFGGQRGGFGGGLAMLRIPEVQKELKMTPEQIAKIDAKQDEVRTASQSAAGGVSFQDMTPEERQKLMEKMVEIQSKAANEILDTTQQKRFKELELQQMGPGAAANRKEVAEALKLTDEQKKGIADIQAKLAEDRRTAMASFRDMTPEERTAAMTKMQTGQKEANDKIVALFTAEQKTKWTELTGAPFTFPPPRFGGGRRN